MAVLKYKTIEMSKPQGKPRVYFCCHPEDFGQYFESVSDEILKKHNCAIWYLDTVSAERDEEFFDSLKQMQLFVVPVTSRLLCTANAALDIDFQFAVKHRIPVLPLMQESGLETLFNQRCGNLQFLDKHCYDVTAISYDEKLKRFLSSVLIDDDLADKIRAAFDAYVFLSYRKKDRKYAQELMRLIHKNDFCRDIAIWYDEFLVPGEDFNDAIEKAIEKSGLFILTVTPSILEKVEDENGRIQENYIVRIEYPMAANAHKPVVPVELVPTDKDQLSKVYKNLPDCTSARNTDSLYQAIMEAIPQIAVKENDGSAEHIFFIGLAYLGGVDVEVNTERALALIRQAAQQGLPEAMEKLSAMYRNGEVVTKDLSRAVEWCKMLVNKRMEIFRQVGTEQAAKNWIEAQDTLVELLLEAEERAAAADALKSLSDLCRKLYRPNILSWQGRLLLRHTKKLPFARYIRAKALLRMGNSLLNEGKQDEAEDAFCDAEDAFYEYETDEVPTRGSAMGMAGALLGIAQMYAPEGQNERAHNTYQAASKLLHKLRSQEETTDLLQLLVECYCHWGDLCVKQYAFSDASGRYDAALAICKQLLAENRNCRSITAMASVDARYGELYLAKRQKARRENPIGNTLILSQRVVGSSEVVVNPEAYGTEGYKKGRSEMEQAQKYFRDALVLLQEPEAAGTTTAIMLAIRCHMGLGALLELDNLLSRAAEAYETACGLAEKLPPMSKAGEFPQFVYEGHLRLEAIYKKLGDPVHQKLHHDTNFVSAKGKLSPVIWSCTLSPIYDLRNRLNDFYSLQNLKKAPKLSGKLKADRFSREQLVLIQEWLNGILPELDAVLSRNTACLSNKISTELFLSLERAADSLHALVPNLDKEDGCRCLEMAEQLFSVIVRYDKLSSAASKLELIRKSIKVYCQY